MHRRRFHIYHSKKHLGVTIALVVLPFLLLLIFSEKASLPSVKLLDDLTSSLMRMTLAYIIAACLGWMSAIIFSRGKGSKIAIPIFDVLQSFPNFAALPLAVSILGPSNLLVIIFLVFTIIWPIFFTIVSSLKLVKTDWEEAATISGLSGWNYVWYFLWPISIPGLVTGSIIGLGEAWEALVATEVIIGTKIGIGDFLTRFSHNPTVTTFGMLGFLVIIFVINKLIWLPLLEWSHLHVEE